MDVARFGTARSTPTRGPSRQATLIMPNQLPIDTDAARALLILALIIEFINDAIEIGRVAGQCWRAHSIDDAQHAAN